jgi:hypothetical protein
VQMLNFIITIGYKDKFCLVVHHCKNGLFII